MKVRYILFFFSTVLCNLTPPKLYLHEVQILHIHQNMHISLVEKSRLKTFEIFMCIIKTYWRTIHIDKVFMYYVCYQNFFPILILFFVSEIFHKQKRKPSSYVCFWKILNEKIKKSRKMAIEIIIKYPHIIIQWS